MAAPVNTVQSYTMTNIRENLADVIYNKDPEETPLFTSLKKSKTDTTNPEWLTDTLRSSRVNANIEGTDITAEAKGEQTRLSNQCQLFIDAVRVSGTADAQNKAGMAKRMAYDLMKSGKEQRLDIEKALFANQAKDAGSSSTPRYMAGMGSWVYTNVEAASGGSDPTGDGTDTRTDVTQEAFSQTKFDDVMRKIYQATGSIKSKDVYLNPFQMDVAVGFTGNNNQRNTVNNGKVENYIAAYKTQYGMVYFKLSLECRARDVWVLDPTMWEIKQFRPMKRVNLAKTGDSEQMAIITELTLCAKNEKSSGLIADCTTS